MTEEKKSRPRLLLRRRRLVKWAGWLIVLWVLGYFGLPWLVPWPAELNAPPQPGLDITDRTGKSLRRLLANGKRMVGSTPLGKIPAALRDATVAAEDKRFWHHGGVDFFGMMRAARDGLSKGRSVSGASTITQQLVKIVHPRPRTLWTKCVEIFTARRIEMTWTKERILEEYLNRLDYGNLRTGCASAAAGYFGKPVADCSPAECALLAGLPQAPTRLNPYRHFDRAKQRQRWVLERMEATGTLSAADRQRAAQEKLHLVRDFGQFQAPHFVDLLLQQPDVPTNGTLTTSLDLDTQEFCELTVTGRLERLRSHHVNQAAVVIIDNHTGGILALTGSRNYADAGSGMVNGATARRSPGSTLKPFTYLLALQAGDSPATIIPDLPAEFMTPSGLYRPKNYSGRTYGPVSIRTALANSLNLAAVRTLEKVGGPEALIEALAACGVTTLTRPVEEYGLGLTIGGGEVNLLEVANAYACLGRLGSFLPIKFFTAPGSSAVPVRVFDPECCWLLADILADNDARVRSFGTQSPLRLPFPVAVKTGTSTGYRDNWTVGYTPEYTVGVWVGNFDGASMQGVSGVSGAGPIFRDIFTFLDTRHRQSWYPVPEAIREVSVDSLTGLPVPENLAGQRHPIVEKFRKEAAPTAPPPERYDASGRVLLTRFYAAWLAGPDNWLGGQAAIAPPGSAAAGEEQGLRILSPLAGAAFLLDPDLPGDGRRLPLHCSLPDDTVEWSSPTLPVSAAPSPAAILTEGRHELQVRDKASGTVRKTWISVRKL
ncbi:MAG: penicillin-binding protein 1C [Verrucomicrobiales bacterium]|nr:penicillin-binding protein 1C [Verrucomicrobiales bacterium]